MLTFDRAAAPFRVAGLALAVIVLMSINAACSVRKPILVVNKQAQDSLSQWVVAIKGSLMESGSTPALSLNEVIGRNYAISYSEAAVMARYAALRNDLLTG